MVREGRVPTGTRSVETYGYASLLAIGVPVLPQINKNVKAVTQNFHGNHVKKYLVTSHQTYFLVSAADDVVNSVEYVELNLNNYCCR